MSHNARILFVAPSAYPFGGVQTWLHYLVPGLERLGWRIELGLVSGKFHDVDYYLKYNQFSSKIVRISNATGTREGRIRSILRAIDDRRPDIVVGVNICDVYEATARLARSGRHRSRAVLALHDIEPDPILNLRQHAGALTAVIATNKLACALATKIGGVHRERVYYAPYGVEHRDNFAILTREGNPTLRLGYVGRLEESQKRVSDTVDLCIELERRGVDYQLTFVGSGPSGEALRKSLSAQVERKRVRFLGFVPSSDLAERAYSSVHAIIITSEWETGPIVAWEAMSYGVPVVTSRYIGSGLEGSLTHLSNCLMFPVGNIQSAADSVERLLDVRCREVLAAGGRKLIRQRYSRESSVSIWSACLESILKQPLPPFSDATTVSYPSSRLDPIFGIPLGESLRRFLRRSYPHACPGDEWPHVTAKCEMAESDYWDLAKTLDATDISDLQ